MRRFFAKLRNLVGRRRAEHELDREISAHLALLEDDFQGRGMSVEEARLAARRAYGGVEQSKELHRAERSLFWVEQLAQDVRHAARGLLKSRAFLAVAMLSLAFGIGVNTAIFTLVNGILLKRLPVPDPDRIVQITASFDKFTSSSFSFPAFRELRRQDGIFDAMLGFAQRFGVLDLGGDPQRVEMELVTGEFFSFFDARPALGRLLNEEDDRVESAHPVCVLSYPEWQKHFGGDPSVIGRTIRIDGVPVEVVGVAQAGFAGPELQRRYDVWAPTALTQDFNRNKRDTANWIWLRIMARLKPGVSFAEGQSRLRAATPGIEAALSKNRANAGSLYMIRDASTGFDSFRTSLRDPLLILMGAVTLVLLVACANLANLLLARANERHQEFAIKLSLGISRWRLLRQLIIESLLVAFGGGVAGILLSAVLTRFLLATFNSGARYQTAMFVAPDATVFAYTFAACILTALIAGLYPAWQASRTNTASRLRGSPLRRSAVRRSLIVAQVALTVVLLFGGSLFARSLRQLKVVDLGYDIDQVLTVDVTPRRTKNFKAMKAPPALADVLARVRALPSVESAALADPPPLSGSSMTNDITVRDAGGREHHSDDVHFLFASPKYLETMRIPLLRGRDFTTTDRPGSLPVVIVNQKLASELWPNEDPIGKHIDGWSDKNLEVVGIVGNSRDQGVRSPIYPRAYQPLDQAPVTHASLEIRLRGSAEQVEREVRQIVKTAATEYQVSNVTTMQMMRDNMIAQDRLLAFLSSLFGVLGALLALVGIYGLIAYSVTRRTREIGIRMSIGAQRGHLLWLFLREATLLLAAGVILGLPLALSLARFLKQLLFEVTTSDPLGIVITVALIALGGLTASILPARRATRVNPVQALRYD